MSRRFINVIFSTLIFISIHSIGFAQAVNYRGQIVRGDGNRVPFNFIYNHTSKASLITIVNGTEKIKVSDVTLKGDSIFFKMPVFESSFKAKISGYKWSGLWTKGTSGNDQVLPFEAVKSNERFQIHGEKSTNNLAGRWAVTFANDKTAADGSIAEFKQTGNQITGTFLTPTGDYRYLEGIVSGKKMQMSGFDGGHLFLFTANIDDKNTLSIGMFYSGAKYSEGFKAVRNSHATVSTDQVAMYLKPGEQNLNFQFLDLKGNKVSINDQRFKNKVVIIQILGSWCPNCMDETAFLSDFYKTNRNKGIEIIGLAYEYSTNFDRSVKSLTKFKNKFDIQYPILITGVTVNDSLRTEKTLPQVTPIKVFPSTIFLDKKGAVRKFDTGFFGPGTGEHYAVFKKEFINTVENLLKE